MRRTAAAAPAGASNPRATSPATARAATLSTSRSSVTMMSSAWAYQPRRRSSSRRSRSSACPPASIGRSVATSSSASALAHTLIGHLRRSSQRHYPAVRAHQRQVFRAFTNAAAGGDDGLLHLRRLCPCAALQRAKACLTILCEDSRNRAASSALNGGIVIHQRPVEQRGHLCSDGAFAAAGGTDEIDAFDEWRFHAAIVASDAWQR